MPADPAKPPTRMLAGEKEAPMSRPSGPPPVKITTTATSRSESTSASIRVPSSFAPRSTCRAESARTTSHAISAHAHQDRSMPSLASMWPAATPPKNPKIASWMAT